MLEQLLNKSLLVRSPDTERQPHFTMLETLREYAQERLIAQGEFERLRDWHACYYLREAEAAEIGMRGPKQLEWQARLTTDRDNFRAAMEWLLQRARDGMRIGLCSFSGQGSSEESIALWQQLDDPVGSAGARLHRVWTAFAMSEYEIAKRLCLEGLRHISTTDDTWLRAQLLFYMGTTEGFTGNYEQMRSYYTQS